MLHKLSDVKCEIMSFLVGLLLASSVLLGTAVFDLRCQLAAAQREIFRLELGR